MKTPRNGKAAQIKRSANRVKNHVRSSARRVKQTATHEANGLWDEVKSFGAKASDAAREQVRQVRDRAGEYYEEGREHVVDVEQSIEDKIRENPVRALMIAAGIGLAGGLLLFRRH